MNEEYRQFIDGKHYKAVAAGFPHQCAHEWLFDYQRSCVEWACQRGKAALFLDTGLGKTNCELAWAQAVESHAKGPVIILAPLCVSKQIQQEAERFGFSVVGVREDSEIGERGIYVTNYENLHNIECSRFVGVVLDESSILKGLEGRLRRRITEAFSRTPYRLSASATPAPNDYMELGTQAEFLGLMTSTEMLATFFIHDGGDTTKWRLKGHGQKKFFEWLASWAVVMRDPSVFGFDKKPELPPLNVQKVTIESGKTDGLLPALAQSLSERLAARRDTVDARCMAAAELANSIDGPVLVWCARNDEGDLLESLIPDSVQIAGSDKPQDKESRMMGFIDGSHRVLVSKVRIAGFGMNFQHCANMIFVGMNDSWEQYYQAVRRCWRFGQTKPVNVWIITADIEGMVIENIGRKDEQAETMMGEMEKIAGACLKDFSAAQKNMLAYRPQKSAPLPKFI
jgi:hypothetical protein